MKAHRFVGLLILLVGTSLSLAQPIPVETELRYEVRHFNPDDNNGWASSIVAVPGNRIEVRALVSYTGTTPVFGLGQITFQPVVRGWNLGDSLITSGVGPNSIGPIGSYITTPSGVVEDAPGVYGRITPFGGHTLTTSTFLRGHVHTLSDGTYLRIARADVTNWIGNGATSGAAALNNTDGQGGIASAQGSIGAVRSPFLPPQNHATQNVLVFKFGFVLAADSDLREIEVFTPPLGIGRSTGSATYGQPNTRWYSTGDQAAPGDFRSDVFVTPASIHVLPAPASGVLVLVAGIAIRRRRYPDSR